MSEHLGPKFSILSHILRRRIDQIAESAGLSGPQSRILHYIALKSSVQDVFQRDIENDFHIRRSSVTSFVQQLEKNEYIERVSVESDARLKKLVLTSKGLAVQKMIGEKIDEFEIGLLDLLSDGKKQFIDQLDTLIETLVQQEGCRCKEDKK